MAGFWAEALAAWVLPQSIGRSCFKKYEISEPGAWNLTSAELRKCGTLPFLAVPRVIHAVPKHFSENFQSANACIRHSWFIYSYSQNGITIFKNRRSALKCLFYSPIMARTSKWFSATLLKLHTCKVSAIFMQLLWCYSQNGSSMPKIGKKRTQIPTAIPLVRKKRTHNSI